MILRVIVLGASLLATVSACKFKKTETFVPTDHGPIVVSADAQPVPDASPPVEQPRPQSPDAIEPIPMDLPVPVEVPLPPPPALPPPALPASPPPPPAPDVPCTGVQLVIATDKLGTAPLKAQIDFHTTSVEISFTPKPISSTLCLDNLTATTGDMLTLRLLQNTALRFIAKRANTAYAPDTTTRIVIDDCLIHAAPWDGRTHDGSCEWTLIDADSTEATLLRK